MLPIRSIVLALCATAAIAAPFTDSACPTGGDCPTCFGRQTPDLREIVCNAESAYIVATGVDTDGKNWMSPRRWQDIFGVHGSRYAIEHFPIDERHWDQKPNATCRTYYAKPAYEITSGQAPRRVESPEVAAFKMSSQCSCAGLIAEAGYAVVAFKNRAVSHSDELATQQLNKDVIVVPLPRGEFKIPSCGSKFTEDKSTISTEKLPAVFANDETQLECDKVTSCPKCEFLQHPEQLKDICKSSKELMIVKQTLSREAVRDSNAPWHMPKIEVYVDKDSSSQDSYEIRTKVTSRAEKGCAKPTLRVLAALTENVEGALTLNNMQLGEQCQCDFLRHDHGFALIRSERELHKKDELSDKETIIMLPRGQYVLPQCSRDDETPRDETDDHKKAQCGQPEESCPVCKPDMTKEELEEVLEADNAVILRLQTTKYFKKSDQSDDVRCAAAEIISVLKGEKKIADSQLSLALPEKCRCDAMLGFGAQFYAVVKRDAIQSGQSLEKLPLNDQVTIFGYNYLSRELVQKIVKGDNSDEAEDRSGYDGYSSYASYPAPSYGYSAPSYGYSAPSYSAPSYGYSAPSYSAPSYGYSAPSYSAPSYGYSAPSYSAPSYGYSAPSYSAPSYGYSAPSYSAPSYSAPSYGYSAPSYSAPSYGYSAPSYSAPSYGYSAPSYSAPSYGYSAPSYSAPSYGYSAPSYSAPSYGYSAPSYSAPSYSAPSYGYSAPSYSAPSYGYSAPSYSAPSYGYSAPSYSAPSYGYSAPSYSAPSYGYSAPSYSAPSYGYSAPSYSAPSYGYSAPSYSAPSYGYSAPSYSAPSYGYSAPSYSAPSYGYSAPSYSAPSYSAPSYSAPSYGYSAPSYSAPSYGYSAPSYSAPSYSAPSYGYSAPSYSAPSYSAPSYGYSAPSYSAPSYGYSAPSYSAPSYGYSAPSYSAPSYGYSAPSYSAPSYGYSAPSYDSGYGGDSYSAPSYSAPSYSAPSYSAPSYSAPSYSAPSYSAPSYSAPSYSAPSYSAPSYSAPSYGY